MSDFCQICGYYTCICNSPLINPREFIVIHDTPCYRHQFSLTQFASDLQMSATGAMDGLTQEELEFKYLYLKWRLDNWQPSNGSGDHRFWRLMYDNGVKQMCDAAMAAHEIYLDSFI